MKPLYSKIMMVRKAIAKDLKVTCKTRLDKIKFSFLPVKPIDVVSLVQMCIECLMAGEKLIKLGEDVKTCYVDVFSRIPHINDMPKDVYARIKLKDTTKSIMTQSYNTPRKYRRLGQS